MRLKKSGYAGDLFHFIRHRLLVVVAVGVLVVLLFSALWMVQNQKYNNDIIYEKQVERLEFVIDSIEKEFSSIHLRQYEFLANENIDQLRWLYSRSETYEKYRMLLSTMDMLLSMNNSSHYITNVKLFIGNINRTITKNSIDEIDPEEVRRLLGAVEQSPGLLTPYGNQLIMAEAFRDTDVLIVTYIDKGALQDYLQYSQLTNDDFILLINRSNHETVVNTGDASVPYERLKNTELSIDNNRYTVVEAELTGLSMDLYWLFLNNPAQNAAKGGTYLLLLFILALVAIVVITTSLFNKSVFKPLRVLLVDAFQQVEHGNFKYRIEPPASTRFANVYNCFNDMVEKSIC